MILATVELLTMFRNSLRERAGELEADILSTESELSSFVSKIEKELITSQVTIPRLQRDLVEMTAAKATVSRRLENIWQLKMEKQ